MPQLFYYIQGKFLIIKLYDINLYERGVEKSMDKMDCNPEITAEKYADLVYKICMAKLYSFDRFSVEDACQTVFLNYMKHISKGHGFKDSEHEKAWFIRTAINCCANICKQSRRRFAREESSDISDISDISGISEDSGGGSLYGSLYDMLALLPEKIRDAVYLFYVEEYSTEEIAKILKTSGASVRMRLKRGRDILRKELGEKCLTDTTNTADTKNIKI